MPQQPHPSEARERDERHVREKQHQKQARADENAASYAKAEATANPQQAGSVLESQVASWQGRQGFDDPLQESVRGPDEKACGSECAASTASRGECLPSREQCADPARRCSSL